MKERNGGKSTVVRQGVSSMHYYFLAGASVRREGRKKKGIPVDLFAVLAGEGEKVELGASCV